MITSSIGNSDPADGVGCTRPPESRICRAGEVVLSTPFLERFAYHLLERLVREGRVDLPPASFDAAVADLSGRLVTRDHASLVSTVERALLANPHIEELYTDVDELREIITTLPPQAAR